MHLVQALAVRPNLRNHSGELIGVEALHHLVLPRLQYHVRHPTLATIVIGIHHDPSRQHRHLQSPLLRVEHGQHDRFEVPAVAEVDQGAVTIVSVVIRAPRRARLYDLAAAPDASQPRPDLARFGDDGTLGQYSGHRELLLPGWISDSRVATRWFSRPDGGDRPAFTRCRARLAGGRVHCGLLRVGEPEVARQPRRGHRAGWRPVDRAGPRRRSDHSRSDRQ
ncbi:hypothetical protein ADK55_18595 [Streptomyces sp. WM4235]|nr:hypothetical protein ADK55_18595 [Streptomyces sp. WM4235]